MGFFWRGFRAPPLAPIFTGRPIVPRYMYPICTRASSRCTQSCVHRHGLVQSIAMRQVHVLGELIVGQPLQKGRDEDFQGGHRDMCQVFKVHHVTPLAKVRQSRQDLE